MHVAHELRRQGHAVTVWTVDRGEGLGRIQHDGLEVRYLPTPLPASSATKILGFLRVAPAAWRHWMSAWRDFRPDVLHVQCFGPNGLYALALRKSRKTPLIVSTHGETFADDHDAFSHSLLLRSGLKYALRDADVVTGCSQMVLDDLSERFGSTKGVVVPNGVELTSAKPAPGLLSQAESPSVFALGRVERMKGFDLLIEAFARASVPPGTVLTVGGDGSELASLRDLVRQRDLSDRVSFLGNLSPSEVAHQMSTASLVVVPSRREAFGIVVLEAWRAGAPLIATSRGGPRDLVRDGVDGLVIDPEDTAALAGAITRVLAEPELARRLGKAGAERVKAYTWEHVVQEYESLYSGLLTKTTTS